MKNKKAKFFCVLLLNLSFVNIRAQEAITVSGGEAAGSGGTAAYSVGQVIYTNAKTDVTEGVQQTYEIYALGINDRKHEFSFTIYSNPTSEDLKFKVERLEEGMHYQLTDIQGAVLENKKISNNETSIQMSNLANGTYFLKITNSSKELNTFKIIKN